MTRNPASFIIAENSLSNFDRGVSCCWAIWTSSSPDETRTTFGSTAWLDAGRRKVGKQYLQMLERGHPLAIAYLGVAMGSYLGHGGTFDHQRRGSRLTGYTHLKQFEAVSNLNVGLFGQQAGLTLDELLTIAGKFACNFSDNAKPDQPYCLDPRQLEYMTRGYKIGQSGIFDPPSPR